MKSVLKPWEAPNRAAYYQVNDLRGLKDYFKRCRTTKSFIPTEAAVAKQHCKCAVCGQEITDADAHRRTTEDYEQKIPAPRGVRGEYTPKKDVISLVHYDCGWVGIMNAIAKMS